MTTTFLVEYKTENQWVLSRLRFDSFNSAEEYILRTQEEIKYFKETDMRIIKKVTIIRQTTLKTFKGLKQ